MSLRKPPTRRWTNPSSMSQLLIFVQAVEEKLFDYTIDSYKAPALNSHTSLYEVHSLATQVKQGRINPGILTPVVDELDSRIRNDPVLDRDFRRHITAYVDALRSNISKPDEFLAATNAMRLELDGLYWNCVLERVRSAVSGERNSKHILRLADTFIAEAELQGFHRSFVFFWTRRYFWRTDIETVNAIDGYLERFQAKERKYTFYLKASSEFDQLKEVANTFGVTVRDSEPDIASSNTAVAEFVEVVPDGWRFIEVSDIVARDGLSARLMAERQVEALANLYTFYVHQSEPRWHQVALCVSDDESFHALIKPPLLPMRRQPKTTVQLDETPIWNLIDIFRGVHVINSAVRSFFKAVDYHRAALEAETAENQLINLWAALEGFVPPPDPAKARVRHFVDMITPSLTLTYSTQLFRDLRSDLEEYDSALLEYVCRNSSGESAFDKVVYMAVAQDAKEIRDTVLERLSDSPLLRFRLFSLNEQFSSNENAKEALERHKDRVTWHIQRIYTTRNQIMHNAEAFPYLETLVENLHFYLDTLLDCAIRVSVNCSSRSNVPGIMGILERHEASVFAELSGEKEKTTIDNYKRIVFGTLNPLSPYAEYGMQDNPT